ncbi:hypothetical protein LUZ60_004505 [Juncus effusus]|nr:hypothetical protein LUZ60_004505 [Juncus effusus]
MEVRKAPPAMAKQAMNTEEGKELEALSLQKVAEFSSRIDAATLSDEVICALHSVAGLIFSVDSSLVSGAVDQRFREEILGFRYPTDDERISLRQAFYQGSAFPTMARLLISNICPKWLAQFPKTIRNQLYDSFFLEGPSIEVLEVLIPFLNPKGNDKDSDFDAICSNVERLLVICLLEKEGIRRLLGEFSSVEKYGGNIFNQDERGLDSRVAQLLASIPDKIRVGASSKLSSFSFFKRVAIQLIIGAEERAVELFNTTDKEGPRDCSFLFVGETFSRIIRRGSTDILVSEIIQRIYELIKSCLSTNSKECISALIESTPKSQFWLNLIETMKDPYSIERLTEAILRQLAVKNVTDSEAYWILWLLFNKSCNKSDSIRVMFVEKFLLRKVFPLSCLRWILQYSILQFPPNCVELQLKTPHFYNTVQRLVSIWSKKDFVQSSSMEQQAYLTAAVGLCLEKMSKQELETTKDVLNSILQGVSCRLESPIDLVRKTASAIALTFSKIVDPKNPLYLDDNQSESVDWEFGVLTQKKKKEIIPTKKPSLPDKKREKMKSEKQLEIRSPVLIEEISDEKVEKNESEDSDSDDSLEPYDLSDDDSDLKKSFSQLSDVLNALRKPDDPDGVERALEIVEKLVRASPDELSHISGDLVRALVHVRCADVAAEGDEDSSELKRQKALISLLVTSPFESLEVITNLLYSSSVDVGQRILILDVMTESALELSESQIITQGQNRNLITSVSQPWFVPSNKGPTGAGPWREIFEPGTSMVDNWACRYERELPSRERKAGKTRKWSVGKPKDLEKVRNRFPLYAAAFMLPAMRGFDRKKHGVDLLNRDFVVLGKLVYMLGVCIKCVSLHPEAGALAPALLDMIKSRDVCNHAEAYVRRAVLFAASCVLLALHPSYVASALIEGELEISSGLEWIRTYSLRVAETDSDTECASMAMNCLKLHSEMALEASRALESVDRVKAQTSTLNSKLDNIIIPFANMK